MPSPDLTAAFTGARGVPLPEVGVLDTFQSDGECACVEWLDGVDVHEPSDLVAREKGRVVFVKLHYH